MDSVDKFLAAAGFPTSNSGTKMPIELIELEDTDKEYLLVADKTSEVIGCYSSHTYNNPLAEIVKIAQLIRKGGGEVTIFKATKY